MHEQDALSVPPQWIPGQPTLDNYLTFFDPTGIARDRRQPGGGEHAARHPQLADRRDRHRGPQPRARDPGRLQLRAASTSAGGRSLLLLYLGSRMVPGIALIVPLYLMMQTLGLLDTSPALIVTYLTFTLPFTIWLLKNYFQGIPRVARGGRARGRLHLAADAARRCCFPRRRRASSRPRCSPS